jgi:hypothetical protein
MKRRLSISLLLAAGLAAAIAAPSAAPPPPYEGNRFLFVVETSSAMKKLAEATRQTVFEMILSGLDGQMQPGDTFGLWTYQTEPRTGRFPMQVWHPTNALASATRAAVFLGEQKYSGKANTVDLLLDLGALRRAVGDLNVFILSDGSTQFQGTQFDPLINAQFDLLQKKRARAKKPFVTTLIVRDGKTINGFAFLAGEHIPLPGLRKPPPALAARKEPPAPADPPAVPAPRPKPVVTVVQAPAPVLAISSNAAAVAPSPTPQTAPAPALANVAADPAPAILPELPPVTPAPAPSPAPPSVRFITGSNLATTAAVTPPPPPQPKPAVAATEAVSPGLEAVATLLPEPLPVAARETRPKAAAMAAATPVDVASAKARLALWMVLGVVGCAMGALVLAVFRARPAQRASYITRSMDQE